MLCHLQVQEAILDYTRVIHMRPDISDYHMARVSKDLSCLSYEMNDHDGRELLPRGFSSIAVITNW